MFWIGAPDPAPAARSSSVMLSAWNASSVTRKRPLPLKRSVPLLVTRLMPTPPVCCVTSAPPVVTCISSSMSKSKYIGEAPVAAISVMSTPSTDHLLLVLVAPREM